MVVFADVRGSAPEGGFSSAAPGRPSLNWGPFVVKAPIKPVNVLWPFIKRHLKRSGGS